MWCCCFVSTDDGFTIVLDRFAPSESACLPFRRLECRQPSASQMAQSYKVCPGGLCRESGTQLTDRRGWGRWVCHPGCCVSGNHSAGSDKLLKMSVATQAYRRQPACGAATANGRPPGLTGIAARLSGIHWLPERSPGEVGSCRVPPALFIRQPRSYLCGPGPISDRACRVTYPAAGHRGRSVRFRQGARSRELPPSPLPESDSLPMLPLPWVGSHRASSAGSWSAI